MDEQEFNKQIRYDDKPTQALWEALRDNDKGRLQAALNSGASANAIVYDFVSQAPDTNNIHLEAHTAASYALTKGFTDAVQVLKDASGGRLPEPIIPGSNRSFYQVSNKTFQLDTNPYRYISYSRIPDFRMGIVDKNDFDACVALFGLDLANNTTRQDTLEQYRNSIIRSGGAQAARALRAVHRELDPEAVTFSLEDLRRAVTSNKVDLLKFLLSPESGVVYGAEDLRQILPSHGSAVPVILEAARAMASGGIPRPCVVPRQRPTAGQGGGIRWDLPVDNDVVGAFVAQANRKSAGLAPMFQSLTPQEISTLFTSAVSAFLDAYPTVGAEFERIAYRREPAVQR